MARILVLDDERGYRDYLEKYFVSLGHEVRTAATGHRAIRDGCQFRPEVIIADWLLADQVLGVYVAKVLRLLEPETKLLVISGYPLETLQSDRGDSYVDAFFQKPFRYDQLAEGVRQCLAEADLRKPGAPVGLCEVDAGGDVSFSSDGACDFHADRPRRFAEWFEGSVCPDMDAAVDCWVDVRPHGPSKESWKMRALAPDASGRRFVALARRGSVREQASRRPRKSEEGRT